MSFLRKKLLKIDLSFSIRHHLFSQLIFAFFFSWSCSPMDPHNQNMDVSPGRNSPNSPLPANNRICFSLSLIKTEKQRLFDNLKSLPVVQEHYRKPLDYHIGIGCMTCRLSSNELTSVKKIIRSHISKHIENTNELHFSSDEVDYYTVNRPHKHNQALVIYPRNPTHFSNLNKVIISTMETLNSNNDFACKMEQDYLESVFKPHITIINSNIIKMHCENLSPPQIDCRERIKTDASALINKTNFTIGWSP